MAFPLAAQEAALHYDGQPLQVPFACTSGNLDWAGLACADDDPCTIFLELNAIAAPGKKLVLAGDLHAQAATLSSILLSSDDGGATWKEPAARVRGASLDQIQFYDPQHGWVAGETVYPLPRDPFFLITGDAGSTWRNRAVTEDGGPGSIQKFVFDSPRHGQVVIDAGAGAEGGRYRQYDTDTAGDSWGMRAATQAAPKLPSPLAPDAEFRLMAGKDAYRIEKRAGAKWLPVAQFAIVAATCKSATSPTAAEPPASGSAAPGDAR